jgi:hypothetical protein
VGSRCLCSWRRRIRPQTLDAITGDLVGMITGLIKRKIIGAIVIVPRSFPGADTIAISAQTLIAISARVQAPTNVLAMTAPGKDT